MIYSKKEKTELVKKILKKFDKICELTGLSRKSLGNIIRTLHNSLPFFLLFFIAYGPLPFVIFSVIFMLLIYSFFIKFNGCILSRLELEIFNDNFCLPDPALELCRMDVTNKNRVIISYIVGSIYLCIFIFILYLRFFYKKK